MEEWEFHRDNGTPVLTSEPVTIIVQFVNREVVSMDTFKGYGRLVQGGVSAGCGSGFFAG